MNECEKGLTVATALLGAFSVGSLVFLGTAIWLLKIAKRVGGGL